MKPRISTNGKAHVGTTALAKALGRTFQHLYALERDGRFQKTSRGYHVERIKKLLTKKTGITGEKEEAAKWDNGFRKWKAKKAKMEYAEARGLLTVKAEAVREQVGRESEFVRALRRLRFDLPPRLHNVPFEQWPDIIDQAATEVLATIVKRIQAKR